MSFKKITSLSFLVLFFMNASFAQIQFEEIVPLEEPEITNNFDHYKHHSIFYNDFDNDGDQDIIISGTDSSNLKVTHLYLNDGEGNYFLDVSNSFIGVSRPKIIFGDVDNNSFDDILILGIDQNDESSLSLYLNDGAGHYNLATINFSADYYMGIGIADIDNDNDLDLLIGNELYTNDGTGNFNQVPDDPFYELITDIVFADVDNDNDQDLLFYSLNDDGKTKLFINDGTGEFTLRENQPFYTYDSVTFEFGDIDNDNDLDLLLTGAYIAGEYFIELYFNDGDGNFSLNPNFNIPAITSGNSKFIDVDSNGSLDVIFSGREAPSDLTNSNGFVKLFKNNGSGIFTEDQPSIFNELIYSNLFVVDANNDSHEDIIFDRGIITATLFQPEFLLNDGTGGFNYIEQDIFHGINFSSIDFSDIDNDNDLDVLITGESSVFGQVTKLYTNDGAGNFSEQQNSDFENLHFSIVKFIDIDNDNDDDLLISGRNKFNSEISKLYLNDGAGNFSLDTNSNLNNENTPDDGGRVFFDYSDVDNDNDQDVLIIGYLNNQTTFSNLYLNNGAGQFTIDTNAIFAEELAFGDIIFEDIDNDNDEDILFNGYIYDGELIQAFKQYLNDGSGNFSEINSNIEPSDSPYQSSFSLGDIDNDNDNDLIIVGEELSTLNRLTQLYTNDGNGNFTLVNDTPFEDLFNGSVVFNDMDGDNDQDVLISGTNSAEERFSNVYKNDGAGNFTLVPNLPFVGVSSSFIQFADIDNDNKQDVFITGWNGFDKTSKLYKNTSGELSIGDFNTTSNSLLYPNPTHGRVYINTKEFSSSIQINIHTIDGKLLETYELSPNNNYSFEITGSKGIYIIEVISNLEKETFKIIKH